MGKTFDDVLTALRDEHALWWHSGKEFEPHFKSEFKAAFRLEDREWERRVVAQGLEISSKAITGLGS